MRPFDDADQRSADRRTPTGAVRNSQLFYLPRVAVREEVTILSAMTNDASCARRSPSATLCRVALASIALLLMLPACARAEPAEADPTAMAERVGRLIDTSAAAWSGRQAPDGQLVDPVKHGMPSYGAPMIAQAIIELGIAEGRPQLVDVGLGALSAQVSNPDNGGFNIVFEVLGLVDAVSRNDALLAGDPRWQQRRGAIVGFIAKRYAKRVKGKRARAPELNRCMATSRCFYNLKLVAAAAAIDLQKSGLAAPSARAAFVIKNPAGGAAEGPAAALTVLNRAARLTSRDARQGPSSNAQMGLLTDPASTRSESPLAYNALCSMMLGHAIEAIGFDAAPANVREAFMRTARALVGYMAPDGAVAYVGRGQAQVWVPAAALYALTVAAEHTEDPLWRGRFLAGSERLIDSLSSTYAPDAMLGLALVPRMAGHAPSAIRYTGIDDYASYKMYEGLALLALRWARATLARVASAPPTEPWGENAGFLDPSVTKFATVRTGGLWYAVHGGDALPDARYDFGIVAAQKFESGRWVDAIAHRPRTQRGASGGGALRLGRRALLPKATSIAMDPTGVVTLSGGFSDGSGPLVDAGTRWTFSPAGAGVLMRMVPRRSRRYEFTVWYRARSALTVGRRELAVNEPGGRRQSYRFNRSVRVLRNRGADASAFDARLRSSRIILRARKGRAVTMATGF